MDTNIPKEPACALETVLNVLGGKWTIMIIAKLLENGTMRFGELNRALPGISVRTLTLRLQELETHKLIRREVYPQIPPKVEYTLTTEGLMIENVFTELQRFGAAAGLQPVEH
jgi:DNA-binding HxlR family transcriptional regulator